jgi:predicted XRE-type DNA-binding protein
MFYTRSKRKPKRRLRRFSIDRLINMLARAGLRVRLETKPRAA